LAKWVRNVLVVEDEPLLAWMIVESLNASDFKAHAANNALQARSLVESVDPDVAILDINLGIGPNGIEFGHWLHRTHPETLLVFLTKSTDPRVWARAEDGQWPLPPNSLLLSKESILDSQMLIEKINLGLANLAAPPLSETKSEFAKITKTQMEILRLAAQGLSNSAIAEIRDTGEKTVEKHLQAVYEALEIKQSPNSNRRVEAVRRFLRAAGSIPVDSH